MITHVRVLLVRLSSTATMKKTNSILKLALIAALLCMKEACADDDITDFEKTVRRCLEFYDCNRYSYVTLCKCDEKCPLYGDCCPSAPYLTEKTSKQFECHRSGYYMIQRCPNETDAELKEMCEGNPSPYELSTGIPATDASTGFLYKNFYCAKCNGAKEKCTVAGDATLSCDVSKIQETVHYDKNEKKWGIRDNRFYPCKILTSVPKRPYVPKVLDAMRKCRYGLISKCSENWEDKEVEEKCHIVHAPVFLNSTVIYKNIFCAVCNNVSLSDLKCNPSLLLYGMPRQGYLGHGNGGNDPNDSEDGNDEDYDDDDDDSIEFPPSIQILLDTKSYYAPYVQPKCKKGEVPFNNKCRELSCESPHLVRKNGICVPKPEA